MTKPFIILESVRLVLRRLRDSDAETLANYRADPEVARYQSWEGFTLQDAIELIESKRSRQPRTVGEWFQFAIEQKESGDLIGDCGLRIEANDRRQAEIGFTLAPAYQGKGYGAEAVRTILDYAFEELAVHRVVAVTDCENTSSIRLLEKIGMRREAHFVENIWFKGKWGSEYQYAMLQREWLRPLKRSLKFELS